MKDLTRDEARERAELLHVTSYDVVLDVTGGEQGFDSTSTVVFGCRRPGAASFVEVDGELVSAELDGRPVGPLVGNRLELPDLQAENRLVVRARFAYSRTGEGLHRFVDPADGRTYLWGMSFLDDAQRMFACFDQPDLKATIALAVDAPPGTSVVANARGSRVGDRWTFAPTERMSTYGFTVAVGPWHSLQAEHDGIALGLHCRQSLAPHLDADAAELFEITGQCFDLQQELFGRRYPFGDTYDQLFVPEFNHGAMENPGAVTFTEDFVFRSRVTDDARRKRSMVVAHEMAHMWFGDLVTMRWWDDLWLNESFAELLGFLTTDRATRFEGTWVDFSATRKAWGYRADQLPSTHPVQGDVPDNRSALLNFDGISYAKGASVLRQLMATVGEEAFFTGVRAYLARHAFANASFADLLGELETASGRDLQEWARVWLQTSGLSTLRPVVTGDRVQVRQESAVLRPHRIGVGLYDLTEEGLVLRTRLDVAVEGESTDLGLAAADLPDLLLLNDGDQSFAKVRFDERSLATARTSLRRLADPLARALVWSALWDACRDAELPAAHFVEAVLAGVDGESDPAVVETLLTQARRAAAALRRRRRRAGRRAGRGLARGREVRDACRQRPAAGAGARVRRGHPEAGAAGGAAGRRRAGGPGGRHGAALGAGQGARGARPAGRRGGGRRAGPRRHGGRSAARADGARLHADRGGEGAGLVAGDGPRAQQPRGPRSHGRLLAARSGRAAAAVRRPLRRRAAAGLAAAHAVGRRDARRGAVPLHAGRPGRARPHRRPAGRAAPGRPAPLRRRAARRPGPRPPCPRRRLTVVRLLGRLVPRD